MNSERRGSTVSVYGRLLQLRVLRLGFFQDGDVGVGVFPEGEEILIGFSGFRRVASEHGAARQPQVGKRVELSPIGVLPSTAPIGALVIQDLFELSRCLSAFTQTQVSQRPGCPALLRAWERAERASSPPPGKESLRVGQGSRVLPFERFRRARRVSLGAAPDPPA